MSFSSRYVLGHALLSPRLKWRHHGIGVLQTYLHEADTETRVHIWHPDLMRPEFTAENGLVHDHRFSFRSRIVHGAIYNERFDFYQDPFKPNEGEWVFHSVTNAREAKDTTGDYNAPLGQIDDSRYHARRSGEWLTAGQTYSMSARDFHLTKVDALAISLIVKTGLVDGYARIARKREQTLLHAFDTQHMKIPWLPILNEAVTALIGKGPDFQYLTDK